MSGTAYDRIGRGYATTRRADPRIAARIELALGDAESVVNVGAGAGSYEPVDREEAEGRAGRVYHLVLAGAVEQAGPGQLADHPLESVDLAELSRPTVV
jgi:hypothetical protein